MSLRAHPAAAPVTPATPALALIDSGTTRTRLRLWDGARVAWRGVREVGARDVARRGHPAPLVEVLHELLAALPADARPEQLVCSGMITSNLGLLEVPHVPVPAGPAEVARGLRRLALPDLPPIVLVPGIITPPGAGPQGWQAADVLRGEEVEVFGLRETLGLGGAAEVLHLGSHHKLMQLDPLGRVTRTVTSLAGEALQALGRETVLAGSVPDLREGAPLDPDAWNDGLQAARRHGIGRALFLVRLGHQLGPLSREQAGAFLHGVLAQLTLDVLRHSDPATPLLIYGHDAQARRLTEYLQANSDRELRHCEAAQLEEASVRGALAVLRAAGDAGG